MRRAAARAAPLLALALTLALTLGACAMGPRYVAPPAPSGSAGPFLSATGAQESEAQPLPPQWWRLYADPTLDGLMAQALTHNQDLRTAAANLAYAEALLSEARAGRLPTTDATFAGPNYGRSALQVLNGQAATTGYLAGLTASYEVDIFGRIRRGIQAARADAEAARAAEDVARVAIAAKTAGAYAEVCGYGEQLDVARRSLELVQQTYDLTLAQRDAGALSDFDLARQSVILAQAKAAIAPLEGRRRAALFTLSALIGRTPREAPPEVLKCRTPPRLSRALPVGDGAGLLRRRPDLRQAERTLAASVARIGVAVADLYPTITIGGALNNAARAFGGLGASSTATYSVGPMLSWSFPNILVARARVKEASAQASAALSTFDGAVLSALADAETALSAYAAELDHHQALGQARTAADEAQRLADVQFRAGAASFLDLISAEEAAVAANQALAQSDQALSSDQVAVFQALGGGWEEAATVIPAKLPRG